MECKYGCDGEGARNLVPSFGLRGAVESGGKQSIFERQMSADLKYRATQI